MAIIERTHVIAEAAHDVTHYKSTAFANGDLNGIAAKGSRGVNLATGIMYINTGTLAATVWTVVGAQV